MIPRHYGAKSSLHEQYQRWVRADIFAKILTILAGELDNVIGFDFEWQAMDGSLIQAPVRKKHAVEGLEATPNDRGRNGSKIHLHVDKNGMPVGALVVGANVHESQLVAATFEEAFVAFEWQGTGVVADNLCLDKGYDSARVHLVV